MLFNVGEKLIEELFAAWISDTFNEELPVIVGLKLIDAPLILSLYTVVGASKFFTWTDELPERVGLIVLLARFYIFLIKIK